jgi:hypothetical protein
VRRLDAAFLRREAVIFPPRAGGREDASGSLQDGIAKQELRDENVGRTNLHASPAIPEIDIPAGPLHTDRRSEEQSQCDWHGGRCPPAIRDQLLQTQGEGFPLKYRELLRRYYRMLAKQKE